MQQTMKVPEVKKPMLRTPKEILQPFIESEKVINPDPLEVYARFERAAILAIIKAQQELLDVIIKSRLDTSKILNNDFI